MNNLPYEYIPDITIESDIRSIYGMKERDINIKIPSEIRTIEDLLIKRYSLPRKMNRKGNYNTIANIMRSDITVSDINDELIKTEEDFILSLFALLSGGCVTDKSGDESKCTDVWGGDILNVLGDNITLLGRKKYFTSPKISNIKKPNTSINNIILFEEQDEYSLYTFTTATESDIIDAPVNGLPDDTITTTVSSTYLDQICASLNIEYPEDNIDKFKMSKDGILMVESDVLDLFGIIAPRSVFNMNKSWSDHKSSFELLSKNNNI